MKAAELFADKAEPTGANSNIDREAWLEARRSGIGGSEAAAILGLDKYSSPLKVWADKLSAANDDEAQREAMSESAQWGHILEPAILAEYGRRSGRDVALSGEQLRSKAHPHLMCTLDGVQLLGGAASFSEAKSTGMGWNWGQRGADGGGEVVPVWVQVQLQHCMLVTGAEVCTVAVLIMERGAQLHYFDVYANPRVHRLLEVRLGDFWDLVQSGKPPKPIGRDHEFKALADYVEDTGEVVHVTGPEWDRDWQRNADISAQIKALEEEQTLLKARIMFAMDGAHQVVLPSWRSIRRGVVKAQQPKLRAKCGTPQPGARSAYERLWFLKENDPRKVVRRKSKATK